MHRYGTSGVARSANRSSHEGHVAKPSERDGVQPREVGLEKREEAWIEGGQAGWKFTDDLGSFEWRNPLPLNELYFPICNEAGMMASVTPRLHGDATTGWHSFLRRPMVMEDIHNSRSARNVWIFNESLGAYSLTGCSARQLADSNHPDHRVDTVIRSTFLAHTMERNDRRNGIRSEITIFSPIHDDKVEVIVVRITNTLDQEIEFTPTTSFPLYARSADNLRDHNHWTSLSHRIELNPNGLIVTPEMLHDEGGHRPNPHSYFVLAVGGDGQAPIGQFPTIREFIGENNLDWPDAVVLNLTPQDTRHDGMEAIGAMRFPVKRLKPGETCEYIVIEGVTEEKRKVMRCLERYGSSRQAGHALQENHGYWKERVTRISFRTADQHFDRWMHWVALQPILRKIYGNSFLPHFDYGKGGRGWRDLWQDSLALLLQNPDEMRESISAYFGGVRLDGSNATIINGALGEFVADRNRVSRVWMDHGVWPYFTLRLYIDQTGDIGVVTTQVTYWRDHQIYRAKARDAEWNQSCGTVQRTADGGVYWGSILEHVLVQHLTSFCNVGGHNNMKLEDADWNDLLDMANEEGESVPFSAFYGRNLIDIAELLLRYGRSFKIGEVALCSDILRLTGLDEPLDYSSVRAKRERLEQYLRRVHHGFSGEKRSVPIASLAAELNCMGNWVLEHIRTAEWIESETKHGFFNGYYDNHGTRVDGDDVDGPRMNLTAQTFAIFSGAATDEQVARSYAASSAILRDPLTGGFRLTTPLGQHRWNLGRGFAVVYGEKETGGAFNHMIVMFLNGLYRRGFVHEGYQVFSSVYRLANDTPRAKTYPGIPEYINNEGQGKYHYLSGSASWLLMTVLTVMFGIRGEYGDLVLEPRLVKGQFDRDGRAEACAYIRGRRIIVIYQNVTRLDFGQYRVGQVLVNSAPVRLVERLGGRVRIAQDTLDQVLRIEADNVIRVELNEVAE